MVFPISDTYKPTLIWETIFSINPLKIHFGTPKESQHLHVDIGSYCSLVSQVHLVDPHGFALFLHLVIHLLWRFFFPGVGDRLERWCDAFFFLNGFYELSASQHWNRGALQPLMSWRCLEVSSFCGLSDMVAFLFSVQRKLILQTFMWKVVRTQVGSNRRNNHINDMIPKKLWGKSSRKLILPNDRRMSFWNLQKKTATSSCSTPAVCCFCSEISTKAWRPRSSAFSQGQMRG